MLAACGISQPYHLNPFFGVKHRVLAAISGDIGTGGVEEFGCRLGTAGGEEQDWDEALHGLRLGAVG